MISDSQFHYFFMLLFFSIQHSHFIGLPSCFGRTSDEWFSNTNY